MIYVTFGTTRIASDLSGIEVDVTITNEAYSAGYLIDTVYIQYYKNRTPDGIPDTEKDYLVDIVNGPHCSRTVSLSDLQSKFAIDSLEDGLFYVIATVFDTAHPENVEYPCDAVLDWSAVYNLGMGIVAPMANSCESGCCDVPSDLEGYVLVYHSLLLALSAEDYDMVEKIWSRFIVPAFIPAAAGCNCR